LQDIDNQHRNNAYDERIGVTSLSFWFSGQRWIH
jgi:hypothetical protein